MNIFKRFLNWIFGEKRQAITFPPLSSFTEKMTKMPVIRDSRLTAKQLRIRKINGANRIYNMYLVKSRAFAQQAANAYYTKGRKGLRTFIQSNG